MIIFYIVLAVYLAAINVYAIILMKEQKKHMDDCCDNGDKVNDGKLFITALLGGALGLYIFMIVKKYRLKSLFLMVLLPVIVAINIYIVWLAVKSNFWFSPAARTAVSLLLLPTL